MATPTPGPRPAVWLGARGPRWLIATAIVVLLLSTAHDFMTYHAFRA